MSHSSADIFLFNSKGFLFFLGTGLVHVSEMSASRIENASEIVDVGEQVWIKVIGREVNTHSHIHRRPFFCDFCRFTEALFTDSW